MLLVQASQSPLGIFKASLIPKITFYIASSSIILCYIISVSQGLQPPFPQCWRSGTARHYPAFLIFRIGTISNATTLILSWFINHFWIRTVCQKNQFKILYYFPNITLILGTMGALGLMGSTANIDTGTDRQIWHTTCASIFFIFTALALYYNFFIATVMYWNKLVSKVSYWRKFVLVVLITIQVFIDVNYTSKKGLFVSGPNDGNLGHILEYTASFSILFYVYLVGEDVGKYMLVYETV